MENFYLLFGKKISTKARIITIIFIIVINVFFTKTTQAQFFDFEGAINSQDVSDLQSTTSIQPFLADLDKDGDMDLYLGGGFYYYFYENTGNNIFKFKHYLRDREGIIRNYTAWTYGCFVDLKNDGNIYLAVTENRMPYTYLAFYRHTGDNKFIFYSYLHNSSGAIISIPVYRFDFADWDNDGYNDFIFTSGGLKWYKSNGDGSFSSSINTISDYGFEPVAVDIDGDGDLDFITGDTYGRVLKYINDNGTIIEGGRLMDVNGQYVDGGDNSYPAVCDLDNDGDTDILIGNSDGQVYYYDNVGNFNFADSGKLKEYKTFFQSNISPALVDFDDDNDLDIFFGLDDGTIEYWENIGDNKFESRGLIQSYDSITIDFGDNASVFAFDYGKDGDYDLCVGNTAGNVYILENDSGKFQHSQYLNLVSGEHIDVGDNAVPVLADLDNDGNLDLYIGTESGNIQIYSNNGNFEFTYRGYLQDEDSIIKFGEKSALAFSDFDKDGDLDLFATGSNDRLRVYINDGTGNFSYNGVLMSLGWPVETTYKNKITFADFDNDGDEDLFIGSRFLDFYKNVPVAQQEKIPVKNNFTVFPNPSDGIFNLTNINGYNVEIYGINGLKIKTFLNIKQDNLQVDLTGEKPGIYLVKIYNNKDSRTMKIILE